MRKHKGHQPKTDAELKPDTRPRKMKKFNETDYIGEFMFNVLCGGEKYHLIITEGLFNDCKEITYCIFSKREILKLIEFLNNIKVKI